MGIPFIDLKTQYKKIKEPVNQAINNVLEHGRYINGPEVTEMEKILCEFTGAKHCLAMASGTDALLVGLMAMGIGPGDEVIVPAFSFYASAEVVTLVGAKVVFCDVEDKTYNLDPTLIEAKITDKTKAIIPVGIFGQVSHIDEVNQIAKKHNLLVLEDAAQSFGAIYNNKKSCNLTHIGTTSFFPAKPLGCYGDGGAVFTNNDDYALAMKEIREHGQSKRYIHTRLGVNARMDSIQCAVIIEKMKLFAHEIEARQSVAKYYSENLSDSVITPYVVEGNTSAWAQYTIRSERRDELVKHLNQHDIPTSIHYPIPIPDQPYYKEQGYQGENFPIAQQLSREVLSLPMHPYLEKKDQDVIIETINSFK